jgi:hypothetical protein
LSVADFDNDGFLDFVSGTNNGDYEVIIWQNDKSPFTGPWTDTNVGETPDAGETVQAVATADFDNDGDMDIVSGTTTAPSEEVLVWENDGSPFNGLWTMNAVGNHNDVQAVDVADLDNDGDMDIVTGHGGGTYRVTAWENIGAQVTETVTNTSPSQVNEGGTGDLMSIEVTHNGISIDNDVELATWRFRFYRSDGTTPLTSTERGNLFSSYSIYLDDGDSAYDGGDTQVTAAVTSFEEWVNFTFTDGDADVAVAEGTPRTYFLVVQMMAAASSATPNAFRVEFDPDGYGSGYYNEVEDASEDKITTIQEVAATMTSTTTAVIPEFGQILAPAASVIALLLLLGRRRNGRRRR